MLKIGLIREGKVPVDQRVAFTPQQVRYIIDNFDLQVYCERSSVRAFADEEYEAAGVTLSDSVSECDVLMGIKEVPVTDLLPGKTYFFFSHTIKKQPYNRKLLQTILTRKIRLIDYELLKDDKGQRVVAFGRFAGIVGAYNGILGYGLKHNLFRLKRARDCFDLEEMRQEYGKVKLPAVKIVLTGTGRVSQGAREVLEEMGIQQVSVVDYLEKTYDRPVYVMLPVEEYVKNKNDDVFVSEDFYRNPSGFENNFLRFLPHTDILISGAFWDPAAPVLFNKQDMLSPGFRIDLIADVTCDIEGSIPSTKRASTIENPFYDYNFFQDQEIAAFSGDGALTVMAVDNLPAELPRDASAAFGDQLIRNVIPVLAGLSSEDILDQATIARDGQLTSSYRYLQDYVDGK